MQLLYSLEACSVLPKKTQQSQLAENTDDVFSAALTYNDAVTATSKDLDSTSKRFWSVAKGWRFCATEKVLDVTKSRRLVSAGMGNDIVNARSVTVLRTSEVGDQE